MDRDRVEGILSTSSDTAVLRRLFARELPQLGAELELEPEAAQHARVLRLAAGDSVLLFDGRGHTARVELLQCGKGALRCVGREAPLFTPRGPRVVLVQCLPKAGKLDDIVRMTTELGVTEIALAISEYCVSRPGQGEHKLDRLERIASEAVRQSEQSYLPELTPARPLAEVLARVPEKAYRAACVERTAVPLPFRIQEPELWLAIGPEGGFSPTDRALLTRAQFLPVALGRSILRTETAAVVGVALALERLGRSP